MNLTADSQWTYITGPIPRHILDPVTSYRVDGCWFAPAFKQGHWDGYERFIEFDRKKQQYRFPTGFLTRVVKALDDAEYRYSLDDHQACEIPDSQYELAGVDGPIYLNKGIYDFGASLLDTALSRGRGIIALATGGGKTEIGAGILKSTDVQSVWITHRRKLARQARDRLSLRLGQPIGLWGGGFRDIQKITVVMVQSAAEAKKSGNEDYKPLHNFLQNCKCVIGDEIHHLESKQWYDVFKQLDNCIWRFGLSATANITGPGLALLGMTGDIIASVSVIDLIEREVLVPPRIWFLPIKNMLLGKKEKYQTVYKEAIVNNMYRNEQIVHVAGVFRAEKKKPLTLVKQINHGEMLTDMMCQKGIRAEFIRGSVEDNERDEYIRKLSNGQIDHIVAVAETMGEGVDIPPINAVINATGSKGGGSPLDGETGRQTLQFLGRALRRSHGKAYCDYVDLADQTHKFTHEASLARAETLEAEGYAPFIKYWHDYEPNIAS